MSEMDKILISIGTDLKDLEKGFATATSKTKDFENKANKIGQDTGKAYTGGFLSKVKDGSLERGLQTSFNRMGSIANKGMLMVTGPILAAGGALFALSKSAGETADRLLDLEQITGLSTNSIQEWQFAAAKAGVSSETMTQAVSGLIKKIPMLEDGTGKAAESFAKLGLSYENIKNQSPEKQMDAIIYSLADMDNILERNAIGAQLFGGAWENLAPMLGEGSEGLAKFRKEAKELGVVVDKETLEAANKLRAELDILKLRSESFRLEIGAKLAPAFSEVLVPALEKGMEAIGKLADKIAEMDSKDIEMFGKIALGVALIFPAIKTVSMLGDSFLYVARGAWRATQFVKGFQIAGMTAHLPLMGGLALLGGALALFVGVLWNAEDESITSAENIGDEFEMLGQKAMGLVQMIAGVGVSVVGMAVSAMGSLVQLGLNAMQDLLDAASKMPLIGGLAGWGADKFGAASDYVGSKKNGIMNFGKDILDQADFRMNSSMDAVYTSRAKKGKLDIEGLEYGDNGFLTGESLDKIKKEKDKERMLDGYTPSYNVRPDAALPEMPEIPGIDEFGDSVDKIGEALKKMGEDFQGTVDSLRGSIGLFDRFRMKTTSTYRLMRNSQERANAFNERERVIQSLSTRGLSEDLMNQLRNTSVEQVSDLRGLEMMDNNQLQQWAGNQYSAESTMKRQAASQVTNNTININMKKIESDEVAKYILQILKRKGISIA